MSIARIGRPVFALLAAAAFALTPSQPAPGDAAPSPPVVPPSADEPLEVESAAPPRAAGATEVGAAGATQVAATDFPFLPEETPGPVSLGDTSDGSLVRGVRVEPTESLRILPRQRAQDLVYASAGLADLLREAAASLHRELGRALWIGHLSRRGGGDIPYSVSHNDGRDADIAFCYSDPRGAPVEPTDLLAVTPEGHAMDGSAHFDVACNWHIVRSLIESERAQVQYLFLSGSLQGLLLRYAAEHGEPAELRDRAEVVMMQPGKAAPHHDHLHLRIHCSEADVLAGCRHRGVVHPWSRLFEAERAAFVRALSERSRAPDADLRRRVVERLAWLGVSDDAGAMAALAERLTDDVREVRLAAAAALARLGQHRWLDDPAEPRELRLAAIAAWRDGDDVAAVPWLDGLLGDPAVAPAARAALAHLTNRDLARWGPFWADMKHTSRRAWLVSGFRSASYDVLDIDLPYTWELVRALGGAPHVGENAAASLVMLYGHEPMPWRPADATTLCHAWHRWLLAHGSLYELEAPAREPCR